MESQKKIGIIHLSGYVEVAPSYGLADTGGQILYMLEVAKHLAEKGYVVDIYTRDFVPSLPSRENFPTHANLRIIRLEAGPKEFISKDQMFSVIPAFIQQMISFIEKESLTYDLFHGHSYDSGMVATEIGAYFNRPVFFTPHSLGMQKLQQLPEDTPNQVKVLINKRIVEEIRIFKSVKSYCMTSRVQADYFFDLYDGFMMADRMDVISPGVDIIKYNPTNAIQKNARLPEKYIYTLGRMDQKKGYKFLINAFDLFVKEFPEYKLVIGGGGQGGDDIGGDYDYIEELYYLIKNKGLEDHVLFIGGVPDAMMCSYYQQATLFVAPALFEPFGITSLEAMAVGKPVVASIFSGIRNVIKNGVNGFLVDTSQAVELAQVMRRICLDSALYQQVSDQAVKDIQSHYSWEAIAKKHMVWYTEFS